MAETLDSFEIELIDLESIRRRIKELSETRVNSEISPDVPDSEKILESCVADFQEVLEQIDAEEQNVALLGLDDLEAYLEQLKREVHAAENENLKISTEVAALMSAIAEDSQQFNGEIEGLECSVKFADSEIEDGMQDGTSDGGLLCRDKNDGLMPFPESDKFEILELNQRIKNGSINLSILQNLDHSFRRIEAIGQIEDIVSGVRVIEFEGNCVRLSLRTPVPSLDGLFREHKLEWSMDSSVSDHELLIEVVDKTMELKNVEIFPDDISLDEILDTMRSSRHLSLILGRPSLEWLVRQVQHRILMCTIRRLLVRDANKSRHSFEYVDRDETITAHLVGGIDAFIKIAQGWPMSRSALKLVSIKSSDVSKSISLTFLFKVKDLANSLDVQTRRHLTRFVDAIEEILIRELRSELQTDGASA